MYLQYLPEKMLQYVELTEDQKNALDEIINDFLSYLSSLNIYGIVEKMGYFSVNNNLFDTKQLSSISNNHLFL